MLDRAVSPDGQYVARRYWVSGGGAAGFLHINVSVQRSSEPFAWCVGVVATTKRCASGPLEWQGRNLVVGCDGATWEDDPYYERTRVERLPGESFEVELR